MENIFENYLEFQIAFLTVFAAGSANIVTVTDAIRTFYIKNFPAQILLWDRYVPIFFVTPSDGTGIKAQVISFPTYYQLRKKTVKRQTRAQFKVQGGLYRQYIGACRLLNLAHISEVIAVKTARTTAEFKKYLQNLLHMKLEEIPPLETLPIFQLEYQGVNRITRRGRYISQISTMQLMNLEVRAIVNEVFEGLEDDAFQQITNKQDFKRMVEVNKQLTRQEIFRMVESLQRHKKELRDPIQEILGLLYAARDYLAGQFLVQCRGSIEIFRHNKYAVSVLGSFFVVEEKHVWVNLTPSELKDATAIRLAGLSEIIFFGMLKKLRMHMNYYHYVGDLEDQQHVIFTKLHINLTSQVMPMAMKRYRRILVDSSARYKGLAQLVLLTGINSQLNANSKPTFSIVGKYFIYHPTDLICFDQVVQSLALELNQLGNPNIIQLLKESRNPILLSQVSGYPLTTKLDMGRKVGVHLMVSCGHISLVKLKKQANVPQPLQTAIIWRQSIPFDDNVARVTQSTKIGLHIKAMDTSVGKFGCVQGFNKFAVTYLTGVGFMDIQTVVDLSGKKLQQSNQVYLGCLVYRGQGKYQECFYDAMNYHDEYPNSLSVEESIVRKMFQVAFQFFKQTEKQFYWYTFNGLKFDYFLLWFWMIKSCLVIGSFGARLQSKGYFLDQVRFYDLRTIFGIGTLKKLCENLHYKKIDCDVLAITSVQKYLEKREQLLKYCYTDCYSLMNLMITHYTNFYRLVLKTYAKQNPHSPHKAGFVRNPRVVLNSFTASGQSMFILRNVFMLEGLQLLTPRVHTLRQREHVFGGMVQVYRHYSRKLERIIELDVKAMYSAIMMKLLPYLFKQSKIHTFLSPFPTQSEGEIILLYVQDIQLAHGVAHPHLPVRTGLKGLIYPRNVGEYLLSFQHLEYLIRHGLIINYKIVESITYYTELKNKTVKQPIGDCVRSYMNERAWHNQQAKRTGECAGGYHHSMADISKLMSNSISGKFLMKQFPTVRIEDLLYDQSDNSDCEIEMDRYCKTVKSFEKTGDPYIGDLVHIGAFITAEGRFQIAKILTFIQQHKHTVFYGDTDSLWVTVQTADALATAGLLGVQVGDLQRKAHQFVQAVFINRKTYILAKTMPDLLQEKTLLEWKKLTVEEEYVVVEKLLKEKYDPKDFRGLRRTSPITQYLLTNNYLKIGFKGFSKIPHWTELLLIQLSAVLSIQIAAKYYEGNQQQGVPILNGQNLRTLTGNLLINLRCNDFHQVIEHLGQAAQKYYHVIRNCPKSTLRGFSKQPTTSVYRDTKNADRVSFVENQKVIIFNPKRKVRPQGTTVPFDSLDEFMA